jgi:sugar phosphate permease
MKNSSSKIFYGWWIVLASFLILSFTSMTGSYGLSLFYKRLIDYFGWSRTALAGAISLSRLETGFLAGVEGFLVDRFGARRMILVGITLSSIGMILLSRIESLFAFYIVFVILITFGRSLSSMVAIDTTVANWFIRRRGTAFGLLRTAVAVGAAGVIVVAWFIDQYGWRTSFVAIGIATFILGIPTALVIRHRPEQYGLLPDGDSQAHDVRKDSSGHGSQIDDPADNEDIGMPIMKALTSKPFWTLSFGFSIRIMVTSAATLHAIPLVEDLGYSQTTAAAILGSMGMVSIIGRLGGGLLNDYIGTKRVAVASVCCLALSCLILAFAQNLWQIILFVAIYAPSYGCSAATMPAIKGDYFGRLNYGSIVGLSGMVQMAGSMLGPIFAAYVFDTTGDYKFAFIIFAILLTISAALFASLTPPRYR